MATYRLKRKFYGMVDGVQSAVGNTLGGVTSAVGKTMKSGIGQTVGGLAGMNTIGAGLGTAIGAATGLGALATPIGMIAGFKIGKEATKEVGTGLQDAGNDMKS